MPGLLRAQNVRADRGGSLADTPEVTHSLPPTRAASPSSRALPRAARRAGLFLLALWVGPVTVVQTDAWPLLRGVGAPERADAESRRIPAGQAIVLQPGTFLRLRLRDDTRVEGKFLGRVVLDSARYAPRFAEHARTSEWVPFALGESLHVSLKDRSQRSGRFVGYGELTLLLENPEGASPVRVPFEFAREIQRANGERVDPAALAKAFRHGTLPSAEAIALEDVGSTGTLTERWTNALRIPVEDIESVSADLPSGSATNHQVAGAMLLGVLLTVVLIVVLVRSSSSSSSGCESVNLPAFSDNVSTRPFDVTRRCFVGDSIGAGDVWLGANADSLAAALPTTLVGHAPPDAALAPAR